MKAPALFQKGDTKEIGKHIYKIKKSSSQEPLYQFQVNFAQSILGFREFKFVQMKGPALFQE